MTHRHVDTNRMTSERAILLSLLQEGKCLDTKIKILEAKKKFDNPIGENILGVYRPHESLRAVITDIELMEQFMNREVPNDMDSKGIMKIPSFHEAGPRKKLYHNPQRVRAAIVTTGGIAPGLHCVIHSIVKRHFSNYEIGNHGKIFGVYDGFLGLRHLPDTFIELTPKDTEEWLDIGGSKLGCVRYFSPSSDELEKNKFKTDMIENIGENLLLNHIDILYVIGGDGSLKVAHEIALKNPQCSVVGIPKTMDNDILWVWESFGFDTAVEQATRVINVLHSEAESTRRICLIELFGAESGYVAANASLGSGHVDLVLIPEVFKQFENHSDRATKVENYLTKVIIDYLCETTRNQSHNPHGVVVVAEGVGTVLEKFGTCINNDKVTKENFITLFSKLIKSTVRNAHGHKIEVFINQPRHNIRAVPANPHDHLYCERLGALAVDNALAGYTDFMISQWLTEFVLVPLHLVDSGQKTIPIDGIFWRQVVNSTGQPSA